MADYALNELNKDEALRLECLRIAMQLHASHPDSNRMEVAADADMYVRYVLGGMKTKD